MVSKVELWNFFNYSISLRLLSWASRRSQCCFNNCSWGGWWSCRRSSSAWARWSSSCCDSIVSLTFCITSSVIISLEFVSPDLSVTVGEDLLALSVQKSPSLCVLSVEFLTSFHNWLPRSLRGFLPLCHNGLPRSIGHGRRRLTNRQAFSLGVIDLFSGCTEEHLTDCGIVVIHVLEEPLLGGTVARSWTLWGTRRKSQWRSSPWAHNLSWRRTPQLTPYPRRSSTGWSYFLTSGKLKGSRNWLRLTRNERRKMKVMRSRKLEETLSSWMRWDKHSDTLSHAMCAWNESDRRNRTRTE